MGWVYLDDGFPQNPKVVEAGPAAAYLYVVGLCYCRRWNTGGFIPAAVVPTLNGPRKGREASTNLLRTGLWTQCDRMTVPGYQVHDWDQWNKSQTSRSEAGRKAAQVRWAKAKRNANAYPNGSGTGMRQDAHSPPHPYNPHPLTTTTSAREANEEDDQTSQQPDDDPGELVEAAVARLALDDLNRRTAQPGLPPIGNRTGWLNQAAAARRDTDGPALARYLNAHPDATVDDLVSTVARTPTGETPDRRLDGQQEAARQREVEGMAQVEAMRSVPIDPQRQDRLTQMRDALRQLPRDDGA